MSSLLYTDSLTKYIRRSTIEVQIGEVPMGGNNPIRIQSMTTKDTMDTQGSIDECIRIIESGCDYVRLTAPSIKEAQNLEEIKKGLRVRGYKTPLIADIHFTPNAAELAARIVEKVRINPGNYVDKKKFDQIDYDDASYNEELERIRDRFIPLINICKEYGTAMRIGTNHGSLSDRIMSRYGDTPFGMVESALEFLRICEDEKYSNVVISMKSSNPQVMVQAYRLLVAKLKEESLKPYPLHLGVTEAGEGEDGRIKSALGIGTLLEDGLGDTVRVSLTEDAEFEAPVAKALVDRYIHRKSHDFIREINAVPYSPFEYERRKTKEVLNFGEGNVPRVIADFSTVEQITNDTLKQVGHIYLSATDKYAMNDLGVDYVYSGKQVVDFMLPNGLKLIQDYDIWKQGHNKTESYPLLNKHAYTEQEVHGTQFVRLRLEDLDDVVLTKLMKEQNPIVLWVYSTNPHAMAELRRLFIVLENNNIHFPVIVERSYSKLSDEETQLYASTDVGGLLIDGFGDGIILKTHAASQLKTMNSLAFGVLQAARTRITKTEYISCPSCGRTLFDLQETTAMIRKKTDHLKGVKIGIMGCIVNGPGEMADADFGYVGSGPGKITLYRGKEVVKKNIASENALDELIQLIKTNGMWIEPQQNQEV